MERYSSIENIFARSGDGKEVLRNTFKNPVVESLANAHWLFTEKVDGMNIRVILFPDGHMEFRGRTDKADLPSDLITRLAYLFHDPVKAIAEGHMPNADWRRQFAWWFDTPMDERPTITLYGEGYGPGIQKGGAYGDAKNFILFDVRIGQRFLDWQSIVDISDGLGIKRVPVVGAGSLHEAVDMVTNGWHSRLTGQLRAEGIVARLLYELRDGRGGRLLVKVKDRDLFVENGQLTLDGTIEITREELKTAADRGNSVAAVILKQTTEDPVKMTREFATNTTLDRLTAASQELELDETGHGEI